MKSRVGLDVVDQPGLVAFELEPVVVFHQLDDFTVTGVERAVRRRSLSVRNVSSLGE